MAEKSKVIEIISDEEMRIHFLGQTLTEGDSVCIEDEPGIEFRFSKFLEKYHGRLNNPGGPPGKYIDRTRCLIKRDEGGGVRSRTVDTKNLSFADDDQLNSKITNLPDDWYFINRTVDLLGPLPKTVFWESDVVVLVDEKHPNFKPDNQFTVYRIDYEEAEKGSEIYTLRAGPVFCKASKDQLVLAGGDQNPGFGPIRFYANQQKLKWRSLKDEAEFNLLIGKYRRIFNAISKSYKWDQETAEEMVKMKTAHAVVKTAKTFYLVIFDDEELGDQVMEADLLLDL